MKEKKMFLYSDKFCQSSKFVNYTTKTTTKVKCFTTNTLPTQTMMKINKKTQNETVYAVTKVTQIQ